MHEQGEELGAVSGEAPIAGLHVPELALDDPERVLDLGDDPVDRRFDRVPRAALGGLAHHPPDLARLLERGLTLGADLALVGPDRDAFDPWARLRRDGFKNSGGMIHRPEANSCPQTEATKGYP